MGRRGVHVPQAVPGDPGDGHGFPALVVEFCTDLAARGYSPATIRARRQALATLAAWLGDRGVTRPVEVTRPMLVRYQRHLFHYRKANGEPLSFRSQNARLLPVRAFFKWAVKNDHLASNPASELELPRVEHRLPKPALTIGEAEQVLAVPDITTAAGLRDRAIIETFYGTGIRRAELAHLNLRDLDVERRTLTVREGKGRKDRMIPIGQRALAWIDRYLTESRPRLAGADDDGTLFLTVDGTGFSLDRLTQLVRDHVTASGVGKQGACHLFRHTLATLMLEGGADIRYIQAMLGHAELSTTQIYTQVSIRALQAVHTATFPAATNHPATAPASSTSTTTTARPRESRRPSCLLLLTKRSKKRTAPTPDRQAVRRDDHLASNLAASNLVTVEGEPVAPAEGAEPIILASAYRHQVSVDDMLHALRFAVGHVRQDDDMVMFIGPDTTGAQLVEVGVVIWWGGEFAIVHALRPARNKYLR